MTKLDYGSEYIITLSDKQIRSPLFPEDCDYVRITDLDGNEIVYWIYEEWQDEPESVMGAFLGAVGTPINELRETLRK